MAWHHWKFLPKRQHHPPWEDEDEINPNVGVYPSWTRTLVGFTAFRVLGKPIIDVPAANIWKTTSNWNTDFIQLVHDFFQWTLWNFNSKTAFSSFKWRTKVAINQHPPTWTLRLLILRISGFQGKQKQPWRNWTNPSVGDRLFHGFNGRQALLFN